MKKRVSGLIWLMLLPTFCFADATLDKIKAKATPPAAEKKPVATAPIQVKPEVPAQINCQYKMPKDGGVIEQTLISTWAENAAVQSFQFNHDNLQTELDALRSCYTSQGWKAFNEALKTSGNLDAIRGNALTVTSQVSGTANVQIVKDKQWKVSIPLKVTYQNKDKELLQTLSVDLLITLNKSGSFGIMQVIAVPKQGTTKKT